MREIENHFANLPISMLSHSQSTGPLLVTNLLFWGGRHWVQSLAVYNLLLFPQHHPITLHLLPCHHVGCGSVGPRTPTTPLPTPPPPLRACGQELVAKGAALGSPRAPKALDAPWALKAHEGKSCPLCTATLSLNPTLTLAPTPALSLVLVSLRTVKGCQKKSRRETEYMQS